MKIYIVVELSEEQKWNALFKTVDRALHTCSKTELIDFEFSINSQKDVFNNQVFMNLMCHVEPTSGNNQEAILGHLRKNLLRRRRNGDLKEYMFFVE